jgi:ABC-type Na+ efflux pump permease subunit
MRNTWLVARREFLQRIRVRGFWLSSIGLPVLLMVVWAISGGQGAAQEPAAAVEQRLWPLPWAMWTRPD